MDPNYPDPNQQPAYQAQPNYQPQPNYPQQGYQQPQYVDPSYAHQQPQYGAPPPGQQQPQYAPPPGQQQPQYVDPSYAQQQPQYADQQQSYSYQPTPMVDGQYNYDDVQYVPVTYDNWYSIPVDQTEYSYMWAGEQAFQPKQFEEHHEKGAKKWNDFCFVVVFIINLIILVIFTINMFSNASEYFKTTSANVKTAAFEDDEPIEYKISTIIFIVVAVSIVLCVIHIVYMSMCPDLYFTVGCIMFGILILLLCALFLITPFMLFFAALALIVFLIFLCLLCKRRKYVIAYLRNATKVVNTNPMLYVTTVIVLVIQSLLNALHIALIIGATLMASNTGETVAYVAELYAIFSFVFTTLTVYYINYLTTCGTAGTYYFLTGTEFMPKSPVKDSFKRATTTSLGSACKVAFIMACYQVAKSIAQTLLESRDSIILMIVGCICLCLICICEAIFRFISSYALIYCALFGIPFGEGCRRFLELSKKRLINTVLDGIAIDTLMSMNIWLFSLIGMGLGLVAGFLPLFSGPLMIRFLFGIIMGVGCYALIMSWSQVLCNPVKSSATTIIICFAEYPKRLAEIDPEFNSVIRDTYQDFTTSYVQP